MSQIVERLIDQWMVVAALGAGFALGFGACLSTAMYQELRARQRLSESRRIAFDSAIEREWSMTAQAKASIASYHEIVRAEKMAAMERKRHLQDGLMGASHSSHN